MNIMSYNIRGSGSPIKRKLIQYLTREGKVNVCLLQENKLQMVDKTKVFSLYGTIMKWNGLPKLHKGSHDVR